MKADGIQKPHLAPNGQGAFVGIIDKKRAAFCARHKRSIG